MTKEKLFYNTNLQHFIETKKSYAVKSQIFTANH